MGDTNLKDGQDTPATSEAAPSNQSAEQADKQAKVKKDKKKRAGIGFFEASVVAVVASVVSAMATVAYVKSEVVGSIQQQTIYVVDSDSIVRAKMNEFAASIPTVTDAQMGEQLTAFSTRLKKVLGEYSESGALLIGMNATMTMPAELDRTQEVAAKLGVDLSWKDKQVSFVRPELERFSSSGGVSTPPAAAAAVAPAANPSVAAGQADAR